VPYNFLAILRRAEMDISGYSAVSFARHAWYVFRVREDPRRLEDERFALVDLRRVGIKYKLCLLRRLLFSLLFFLFFVFILHG